MADEKRCTKCKRTKPLDDFHRNRATPDGRQYWCKDCILGRTPTDPATPDPEPARAPRGDVAQRGPKAPIREHGLGDGNWKPAVTLAAGPCIKGCGRTGDVLGRCHVHAAAELAHAGIIRRRAWLLLEALATDDNLQDPDVWRLWLDQTRGRVTDLIDVLTDDQEPAA